MTRRLWTLVCLLFEYFSVRRDARVRFLYAQVKILRSRMSGNRLILSPAERAELLRIGSELDHDVKDVLAIASSQTYRRWLRLVGEGRPPKPVGRPRLHATIRELILRLARENIHWGFRRIVGELGKLHLGVGRSTIRRILMENGLFPPPTRRSGLPGETPWRKFIRVHMNTLVACDFFVKKIVTPFGMRLAYGLFFIHLGSRKVFLCPATYYPYEPWVRQQARNVQMWLEDQGITTRFLLHDRDTKFTAGFDELFKVMGTQIVKTPVAAPDANAFAETWVGTLKRECLDYFVCFSLEHLDHIGSIFTSFYNTYRPHQGLGNQILPAAAEGHDPPSHHAPPVGRVRCRRFLGGLLRHYYRDAA